MGFKTGIAVSAAITLVVGILASVTVAFAYQEKDEVYPFSMLYSFFQELKYGDLNIGNTLTDDTITASVIVQLQDEVTDLKSRIKSLEDPPKVYTTEVEPVTNIDCSNRNMIDAFLSGWCPHYSRNIYFIEDSRVHSSSVIAVSLKQSFDDGISEQNVCGVIDQDVFNFSFHDDKTGEVTVLEELHGFLIKCDRAPIDYDTILRYTVVNT